MAVGEKVQQVDVGAAAAGTGEPCTLKLDADLTITACSAASTAMLGLGEDRLVGRSLGKVLDLNLLQTLLAGGFSFGGQPVFVGRRRLLCDYRPAAGGDRPEGQLSFRRDEAGQEAPALQEILVSVDPYLDLSQDGVLLIDGAGRIVMVNPAVANLQGIPAGSLLGRPVDTLTVVPPLKALAGTMQSGRTEVSEMEDAAGNELVISRWPVTRDGAIIGAFGKVLFRPRLEEASASEREPAHRVIKSPPPPSTPAAQNFKYDANSIIGHSRVMKDLKEKLLRIADRGSNVLLMGESGTGKELFAHAIHAASRRRPGPFIRVNCAAIPDHLLESELFGYVEGAFTGAKKGGQVGKFEQAHNGTIFLDEISDMPISMQAKLLRVLQEKEVTPLGSTATRRINMRVVAATNVDLQQLVADGRFRTDLYYRLNIVALTIPPLRERAEDIYFITKHLIDDLNAEFEMRIEGLEREAWEAIQRYAFPGNIRELRNAIESAFNLAMGDVIKCEDLPRQIGRTAADGGPSAADQPPVTTLSAGLGRKTLQELLEGLEKDLIAQALKQCDGSKLTAANLLGISRPGLYKKLQKYDLQ